MEFRPANPASPSTGTAPSTLIRPVLLAMHASNAAQNEAELSLRLSQLELNQPMPAQVQAQLNDGSYLVQVANTVVQMNLPSTVNVGDQVTVTLIEKSPNPVFLFNNNTPSAATESSVMTLSTAARLINSLVQSRDNQATQTPIVGRVPLTNQPDAPAAQLAQALRTAVSQSGLFYESHLSQWTQGQLSLTAIQNEPQANQTSQLPSPPAQAAPQSGAANLPAAANAAMPSASFAANTLNGTQTNIIQPMINLPVSGHDNPNASGTGSAQANQQPAALTQLVQQQLQTLEQQQVFWQGQAWPGQNIQWSVGEDPAQDGNKDHQPTWRSQLNLDMPGLGHIGAYIQLSGGHIDVRIQVGSTAAAAQLLNQQTALSDACTAAGLTLNSLHVTQPDQSLPDTATSA